MLYGSEVGFLIDSMVYKLLGKFEPYMFWRQGFRSLEWKPLTGLQRVKQGLKWAFGKGYSTQVGLIMNIKNDLRSIQIHIVSLALALAWEGKILGLESKEKIQPASQWSFISPSWYIIIYCEKHSPRYRNLDKADPVKELKDQVHVWPIKLSKLDDGWLIAEEKSTRF